MPPQSPNPSYAPACVCVCAFPFDTCTHIDYNTSLGRDATTTCMSWEMTVGEEACKLGAEVHI